MKKIELNCVAILKKRFKEKNPLIQVVLGPRQVGKTTSVQQFLKQIKTPYHYASADDVLAPGRDWILANWLEAKALGNFSLLALDEIQKVPNWSETIKKLWDEQINKSQRRLKVLLLGSSSLKLQTGLSESLAGRFEEIRVYHWDLLETNKALAMPLNKFLKYGGYPGAYAFTKNHQRWQSYVKHSILDRVIDRDILHLRQVKNPALFRQAFEILCNYPSQIISYRKLLGQLQDKGNTELIKHYIELYEGAFLFKSLTKYSAQAFKIKSSSPKIIPLAPCLPYLYGVNLVEEEKKGFLFESIVGCSLLRLTEKLFYWREGNFEIDFVINYKDKLYAIEVKSGRKKKYGGLTVFCRKYPKARPVIINRDNYGTFLATPKIFLEQF